MSAKRVALVIGNGEYKSARLLQNAPSDAKAVSALFRRLGFSLVSLSAEDDCEKNLGQQEMRRVLANFSHAADTAEIAAIYFAGHGIELDGKNYLLPTDADLSHVRRVYFEAIGLFEILDAVQHPRYLRLMMLDACRNNPFPSPMRGFEHRRSSMQGLAYVEPRGNTLVAYAAKHGTTASDGIPGSNSPFTKALLVNLENTDLELRLLFGGVRDDVLEATRGAQEPHLYGSLGRQEIYLTGPKLRRSNSSPEIGPSPAVSSEIERAERIWITYRLEEAEAEQLNGYIAQFESVAPFWVSRARARLIEVETTRKREEDAAWEKVLQIGTIEAYKHFLQTWPASLRTETATVRVRALQDQRAWSKAAAGNSVNDYLAYLNEFNDGVHAEEARVRVVDLQRIVLEILRKAPVTSSEKGSENPDSNEEVNDHGGFTVTRSERRFQFLVGKGGEFDKECRLKSGESFQDTDIGPEMVVVVAGEFLMGSAANEGGSHEQPQHKVNIGRLMAVGKFPVTFREWDAYLEASEHFRRVKDSGWDRGRRPATHLSWNEAKAYVEWIATLTNKPYRLLSEAEWEYCCRAGTATPWSTGSSITKKSANFFEGGSENGGKTVDVTSFSANAFGLCDMHGNVWEWVEDCWNANYEGAPIDGSAWVMGQCTHRVLRGGAYSSESAYYVRSSSRGKSQRNSRYHDVGFRIARDLTA